MQWETFKVEGLLSYGLLAFAAVFLAVGVARVVEFAAAGISLKQRRFLIPLHLIGCLLFSAAIVVFAIDPLQRHSILLATLFSAGGLILFPTHIYVALKRKIKLTK
jgi:hypothetical protein